MVSLRTDAISEMNTPTSVQALTFDKKNDHLIVGLAGICLLNAYCHRWTNHDL
jgi:hypothetical protein